MFYEVELVTRKKNSIKLFELVTRSVTSFSLTRFRKLTLQLKSTEPQINLWQGLNTERYIKVVSTAFPFKRLIAKIYNKLFYFQIDFHFKLKCL